MPFAFTARGDYWCWHTGRITSAGEPAVVYCPRDCFEGHWDAPSFIGWLYALTLGYCASFWRTEAETKIEATRWAELVAEFGPAEWALDLRDILSRPAAEYEWGPRRVKMVGLLTDIELEDRIIRAFGEDYHDVPFIWDLQAKGDS